MAMAGTFINAFVRKMKRLREYEPGEILKIIVAGIVYGVLFYLGKLLGISLMLLCLINSF